MRRCTASLFLLFTLLLSPALTARLSAQEPSSDLQPALPVPPPIAAIPSAPAPPNNQLIVPVGTRLPLLLRNPINTRTAKPGDSVYFETAYPIAVNNRMAIPMGSFMRGEILEAKRPGRIKGRGEIRLALQQLTFPNGYTLALLASPSSVDPNTGAGVDSAGKIGGPSSSLRDTTAVLLTTAGGAYIGALAGGISNDAPGRGALIGGGAGGLGALIAVLATRGPEAELPRGTMLDVNFDRPLILDLAYLPASAGPGIDPQPRYLAPPVDAREGHREPHRRHAALPGLLPFLFLPLLR
jgi:type IV secretion system protein VirB10